MGSRRGCERCAAATTCAQQRAGAIGCSSQHHRRSNRKLWPWLRAPHATHIAHAVHTSRLPTRFPTQRGAGARQRGERVPWTQEAVPHAAVGSPPPPASAGSRRGPATSSSLFPPPASCGSCCARTRSRSCRTAPPSAGRRSSQPAVSARLAVAWSSPRVQSVCVLQERWRPMKPPPGPGTVVGCWECKTSQCAGPTWVGGSWPLSCLARRKAVQQGAVPSSRCSAVWPCWRVHVRRHLRQRYPGRGAD